MSIRTRSARAAATTTMAATTLAAAVLAAAVLPGGVAHAAAPNGDAAKPASTVTNDAIKALKALKTVKVTASIRDGAQTIRFAFSYVRGIGATGTYSEGSASATIIQLGRDIYFKGNADLLGDAGSAGAGRYVHFSSTSPDGREFAPYTNLATLAGNLLKSTGGTVTVSSGHLGGIAVAVLTGSDGGRAYVNGTGAPLPVKITGTASNPGTVTFTRYNAPVTLTRPTGSITIKG